MKNQNLLNNKMAVLFPWYVTGLTDGDGMFGCIVFKEKKELV